jgi:hypothetical protein
MRLFGLLVFVIFLSCSSDSSDISAIDQPPAVDQGSEWDVSEDLINGSGRPFPLALDPVLYPAHSVDFLPDESLVAVVNIENETRVYPYVYIEHFESINDRIGDVNYSMTYCPITQSGMLINREHKQTEFILRASGFLLYDNVILLDETSQTFISQMLKRSIRGSFIGEYVSTFNFIEMNWKTVKENFPNSLVFTNSSVSNNKNSTIKNKADVKVGDLVYGIIDEKGGKENGAIIYHYDDFGQNTTLKNVRVSRNNAIVIGNSNDGYITSYYKDSQATFEAIQDEFPIIMKDSDDNYWNVFGVAVNGPRTGDQLKSPTGFFALFWAWESFYDNVVFDE